MSSGWASIVCIWTSKLVWRLLQGASLFSSSVFSAGKLGALVWWSSNKWTFLSSKLTNLLGNQLCAFLSSFCFSLFFFLIVFLSCWRNPERCLRSLGCSYGHPKELLFFGSHRSMYAILFEGSLWLAGSVSRLISGWRCKVVEKRHNGNRRSSTGAQAMEGWVRQEWPLFLPDMQRVHRQRCVPLRQDSTCPPFWGSDVCKFTEQFICTTPLNLLCHELIKKLFITFKVWGKWIHCQRLRSVMTTRIWT